ncbi:DUF885 domain-containing protein, partial [Acidobacteria bacterium AH-259-G07]|nr:DUF885 domain-containing protein [Acidobacteria bacterium AH-259-G07]
MGATLVAAQSGADRRFEELARRFVDEFPALSPVTATQLGDHRYDGQLDEVSREARAGEAAFLRRYLEELSEMPREQLSRANQVDIALLKHSLASNLWKLEELQEWAWNPLVYTRLTGGAIYALMAREFAPLAERLSDVADRLEKMPRLLEQVRKTLRPERVPKIHAETAVRQNRGVLSILENTVKPEMGALSEQERTRLKAAMEKAAKAVQEHQKWLETELLPNARGDFRIGCDLYDRKLAFSLHTPLTRREIRRQAEREFGRRRDEMYRVAQKVYAKQYPYVEFPDNPSEAYKQAIIRAGLEVAYRDLPGGDEIVDVAGQQLAQATVFVREKNLVTVPQDPVEIIVMPEFKRGVTIAYCDSPGPLDVGQKTFYAVSPIPETWNEQQVRSFLREYNLFSIQDLTIHEAMPGHFLQLALSNRYPSTLRALLSSGPFIEGWAVYAEQMMIEQGYLDGDPRMKLINLKWLMRAITNSLMDQAIHCDGMTREAAMKLMMEGGFQEEREAALKWVRAQLTSAQLSTYFLGYQEHIDLRNQVRQAWGSLFSLKKYHDTLLSFGSPPVQFVRALMLDLPI